MNLMFKILIPLISPYILTGCGGGAGSSSSRKTGRTNSSKQYKPFSSSGNSGGKSLSPSPVSRQGETRKRPYRFPRTYPGNAKSNYDEIQCPQFIIDPTWWQQKWSETCRALTSERSLVSERDREVRVAHPMVPNLAQERFEDIIISDFGKTDRKLSYVLDEQVHSGSEVSVFYGHLQDSSTSGSSSSSPPPLTSAVLKYSSNCRSINANKSCEENWRRREKSEVRGACKIQQDEDQLLNEYIVTKIVWESHRGRDTSSSPISPTVLFLSPPVLIPSIQNWKINFALYAKDLEYCQEIRSSIRLIVEERVGRDLEHCLYLQSVLGVPEGKELVRFATRAFIRVIQLLQKLHEIGFIHGDIHYGNIAFQNYEAHEGEGCDFENPESLLLIDFGLAEFFPADFGKNEQSPDTLYARGNPEVLSLFELKGYRRSRRDDVLRAFEMYIDIITSRKVSEMFRLLIEKLSKPANKGIDIYKQMAIVKRRLLLTTDHDHDKRCQTVFEETPELCNDQSVARSIDNYSGISGLLPYFQEKHVADIFAQMELALKGVADSAVGDAFKGAESPDSIPDYEWLLGQANQILINLQ